jgi:anthranilate synthase
MATLSYTTPGGIKVTRLTSAIPFKKGLGHLLTKLDRYRGIYLSSGYEYPERYSRWDVASVCPPVEIVSAGQDIEFRALNARGDVLNRMLYRLLEVHPHWERFAFEGSVLQGRLKPLPELFPEEERSKQPSAFSILRAIIGEFQSEQDSRLALVGAFGYDLLFQFDPVDLKLPRKGVKDLQLFLCDDIYYMDRKKEQIERFR